jgi:hypothetical protein
MRRFAGLLLLLVLAACGGAVKQSGLRNAPDTRYLGQILDARDLGAEVLRQESATDPGLAAFLQQDGHPDFVLLASPDDLELIYTRGASELVHFHRAGPDEPSTHSVVSPLPSGLIGLLPADMRAGTGAPLMPDGIGCWHTTIPGGHCRTCCRGTMACTIECPAPPA